MQNRTDQSGWESRVIPNYLPSTLRKYRNRLRVSPVPRRSIPVLLSFHGAFGGEDNNGGVSVIEQSARKNQETLVAHGPAVPIFFLTDSAE